MPLDPRIARIALDYKCEDCGEYLEAKEVKALVFKDGGHALYHEIHSQGTCGPVEQIVSR